MYSNKHQLLAADQDLLPGTVEQQLAKPPRLVIRFVNTTEDIFKFCLADATKSASNHNRSIMEFLPSNNTASRSRNLRQQAAARQARADAARRERQAKRQEQRASKRTAPVGVKKITAYRPQRRPPPRAVRRSVTATRTTVAPQRRIRQQRLDELFLAMRVRADPEPQQLRKPPDP